MKVKSESEVTQSSPTLCDPMDCSLPGSSICGIFQARVLVWGARCRRAQPSASAWRAASGTPRKQIKAHVTGSNGTPLQFSCLENPRGGGAWWAAVHGVTKSQTRLSNFTFTFHFYALEKEMASHSNVLAWRIPGTGNLVGCHLWGRTESDTTEVT